MRMLTQVLFLQGGGAGAYDEDKALAESLRGALGSAYTVHYPAMPREDDPDYELWWREIERELQALGDDLVVVAHSVGAFIFLKFIVEHSLETRLAGNFLIAPPFIGSSGWNLEGMALPQAFAANLPKDLPLFLYHARDDEVVPFAHLDLYRQSLSQAIFRPLDAGGHQLNNDLSQVAADIKSVIGGGN
jgi:uncharacterized protein